MALIGINNIKRVGWPGPSRLPWRESTEAITGLRESLVPQLRTFLDLGVETKILELRQGLPAEPFRWWMKSVR